MPWVPGHFSASAFKAMEAHEQRQRDRAAIVPFFDGLRFAESSDMLGSFVDAPDVLDHRFGQVSTAEEFAAYTERVRAWLDAAHAISERRHLTVTDERTVEEVIVRLGARDDETLSVAVVVDWTPSRLIQAVRVYYLEQ